jgi:phage gp45-like
MKKVKISSTSNDLIERKFSAIGATGETYTDRAFWQQVGFSSIPKPGDFGLVTKDGNFYAMIATAGKSTDRPNLIEGDRCIHASPDRYILLSDNGNITVSNDNAIVTITNNGEINIKGNGNSGSIKLGSGSTGFKNLMTEDIISTFNGHRHVETGALTGGPVDATSTPVSFTGDDTSEVQAK